MTRNADTPHGSYLFGPVQSRRLGRSLGIDIVAAKQCTLDCVYCEVGRTNRLTAVRDMYVPVDAVVEQVARRLRDGLQADYLTITGSGEPTLHAGIGQIITRLHQLCRIPVAVLTNATLLGDAQVRQDLLGAELILPSLDAGTQEEFETINRPLGGLTLAGLVEGLRLLREEYRGQLWLEVLLVGGITDNEVSVARLAALAARVRPDRIQLNTVTRPPAQTWALPVAHERLQRFAMLFEPRAEVICPVPATDQSRATTGIAVARSDILAMLRRRPCPADEIAAALGVPLQELQTHLDALVETHALRIVSREGIAYYVTR